VGPQSRHGRLGERINVVLLECEPSLDCVAVQALLVWKETAHVPKLLYRYLYLSLRQFLALTYKGSFEPVYQKPQQ
jgi:hypothetical protein